MSKEERDHRDNLFTYQSPCIGRRIRLIRLVPGSGQEQLAYSMVETDLDGYEIRFMAISYVWGDPNDTRMSLCNGKAMRITRSLHSALWQLREDKRTRHVWADAVCINQMDNTEKTMQVRMMGDIYAKAYYVLIWLGEATENDETGLALMKRICDLLEENPAKDSKPPDLKSLGFWKIPSTEWCAMLAILCRPWFYRVWVVQEYCRARSVACCCGPIQIPFDLLLGVRSRIKNHHQLEVLILVNARRIIKDNLICGPVLYFTDIYQGKAPLVNLLLMAIGLNATEERDRVFALVDLSSDISNSLIDYDKDIGDILRQIATKGIQNSLASSDPNFVFKYLCLGHCQAPRKDRSSWAPSFDHSASHKSLGLIFKSEKLLKAVHEVRFDGEKILQVRGKIIDHIQSICHERLSRTPPLIDHVQSICHERLSRTPPPINDYYIQVIARNKEFLAFYRRISEFVNKRSTYVTGENLHEVFWRSIIFDTQEKGKRASPEILGSFEACQESLALQTVWMEHKLGMHLDSTQDEILKEVQRLFPQVKWRPLQLNEIDCSKSDIWAQIHSHASESALVGEKFDRAETLFPVALEGDQICAFAGSRFPFVIRPCDGGYRLIGACYMHGIMEGEAYELPRIDGVGDFMIRLV